MHSSLAPHSLTHSNDNKLGGVGVAGVPRTPCLGAAAGRRRAGEHHRRGGYSAAAAAAARAAGKKAMLTVLMLEVEATVSEAGRPLGAAFGDASQGLCLKLLRPTPAQVSAIVRLSAQLEQRRKALGATPRNVLRDRFFARSERHMASLAAINNGAPAETAK